MLRKLFVIATLFVQILLMTAATSNTVKADGPPPPPCYPCTK